LDNIQSGPAPRTLAVSTAATPAEGSGRTNGFALVSKRPVPGLRLVLEHYRHKSGADHFHLANDDPHRAFMVAFRTYPDDSTGLPHILEHLALCGSQRYPVRDPFFLMLRRSLQTFMNAMTSKDATYYPFATLVAKDFDNLLGIYLDAVFKPNLHPLDFAQEGYRLAPREDVGTDHASPGEESHRADTRNGGGSSDSSGWAFKGVVYNEMKGATGNADSQMMEAMASALVPDTPYRHNSGGDPQAIPSLSHGDLVAFHERHYTAANACLTTYGDLDVQALHERFAPYLEYRPGTELPVPPPQSAINTPSRIEVPVPLEAGQDPRDVTVASLTWVRGDMRQLQDVLLGELLEHLMLGHAGAPLRRALESSGLGRALGYSGFGSLGVNGIFSVDLKGIDPADYPRFEPLVMDTLRSIHADGFDDQEVAAALHQLELSRRTISGDRFPFGLELAMRVADAWRQDTDPIDELDQDAALEALRERVAAPGFWRATLAGWLLENPHRALLLAMPDPEFNSKRDAAEGERLGERLAVMDTTSRNELAAQARDLAERQASEDDVSVLPELLLSDVPKSRSWAEPIGVAEGVDAFRTGTNGILHQVAALPLVPLDQRELDLLPLLTRTIGRLGVGKDDYADYSARLNALVGGLHAWYDLRTDPASPDVVRGFLFVETSGLARRAAEFSGLVRETLLEQRFDEHARLAELIEQSIAGLMSRVSWRANDLAQDAAARGLGGRAALDHRLSGLGRLAWLKRLAGTSGRNGHSDDIVRVADELATLLDKIRQAPVRVALIGDSADDPAAVGPAREAWSDWPRIGRLEPSVGVTPLPASAADEHAGGTNGEAVADAPLSPTAFTTATQVNYVAMAMRAVPLDHPDAAALSVAARYLANNFLHTKIREQGGAYGSRAMFSANRCAFVLSSYRDPRFAETIQDMRDGLTWLADVKDDERLLREAILGVIAGLDRPSSPSGEGRRRFVADLVHFGPDVINRHRARVLAVRTEDMRRAAKAWLDPSKPLLAAVTSRDALAASGLGWESRSI